MFEMYVKRFLAFAGMLMLFPVVSQGELITVANPGFEDISGQTQSNEFTFGAPNDWALYDPNEITGGGAGETYFVGTLDPIGSTFFSGGAAAEGDRVGIAYNRARSGGGGEYGLQQVLLSTLQPNSQYSLQVEIGNIASGTSQSGTFFNLDGFPGYRVDLMAGGVMLAQDNNTLAGAIPEGQFRTSNVTFQTGATHSQLGQLLHIRLVNLNQVDLVGADLEVDFDHVRFNVTSVPEPSALLVTIAVASAHLVRRKRRLHR